MTAIVIFGTSNLTIASVVGVSSFIFSYFAVGQAGLSYAGTLGAVTTAIIMIGSTPTVTFAAERFLEISVGLLTATLVSQFLLPIHARTHLRRAQAQTLEQLRDYYTASLTDQYDDDKNKGKYEDLDESIVQSLLKQRQLAKESIREPLGFRFRKPHFIQSLYCEKEILRSITFMHQAFIKIKGIQLDTLPAMIQFNETVLHALNALVGAIYSKKPVKEHIHIPELNSLKKTIFDRLDQAPRETVIYADSFIFSAEILTNSLNKLAHLYKVPVFEEISSKHSD